MAIFGEDKGSLRCSFCGKRREQVANLIAGPGVFICVDCVELCNQIIGRDQVRPGADRAVAEAMTEKALAPLDSKLGDLERSLASVRSGLGELSAAVTDNLRPVVAEAVGRLTCPHCGRRLDEPTQPSPQPSEAPLKEV